MDFFNSRIHAWYSLHHRNLPWRNTTNPYHIWLSEIILQQTRIDQGLAYYLRFTEEFPSISQLADASEDQVLKIWQGLGYYSRARNLHFTAKYIQEHYSGIFPNDYQSIRALKGIGEYTAAAIASIAFNLEHAAVDGNVYRILSRFFGISEPTDTAIGKKRFRELAAELIKDTDPGMHNQALMEFGALQCTPQKPDCRKCPLNEKCFALSKRKIGELPVKQNKQKQRDRYFSYLVFSDVNHTWLRKRNEKDIWKNLFEFPMIETSDKTEAENLMNTIPWTNGWHANQLTVFSVSNWKVHILSHQRIHYRFIHLGVPDEFAMPHEFVKVNKKDIFNFAVPKLMATYLNEHWETR